MKKFIVFLALSTFLLSACDVNVNVNPGGEDSADRPTEEGGMEGDIKGEDGGQVAERTEAGDTTAENSSGVEAGTEAEAVEDDDGFFSNLWSKFFGRAEESGINDAADGGSAQESGVKPEINLAGVNKAVVSRELPTFLKQDIGAELLVCGLGTSCTGDMGSLHWRKETGLTDKDKKRSFRWSTKSKDVTGGIFQVFRTSQNNVWPGEPIYSMNVGKNDFIFDFNFVFASQSAATATPAQALEPTRQIAPLQIKPESTVSKLGLSRLAVPKLKEAQPLADSLSLRPSISVNAKALLALQPVYYVRIIPVVGDKLIGAPTNEVVARFVKPEEAEFDEIKIFSPAKVYDVKIKDFKPFRDPDDGVCSHAMIVTQGGKTPMAEYKVGQRICPASYKGMGGQEWYEMLWDAVTSGVNWLSKAYNDLKAAVVDVIGAVACGGNSTCQAALAAGLDMGLVALGIPPTIPNFDALMEEGFDYVASQVAAAAGCADAICAELVKSGLKTALDQSKSPNPACMGEAEAHNLGIEPVCLPANIKTEWDPAATHRPAQATIEIKRNNTPVEDEKVITSSSYRLLISSFAKNESAIGGKIINIEPYGKSLTIENALEGQLFQYKTVPLPYLAPGQSISIPVVFAPTDYWVPGHKELMGGWTTVTYKDGWPQYQYNDWWRFYYGAKLNLVALIDGCDYTGTNDCTVSVDSWEETMPLGL